MTSYEDAAAMPAPAGYVSLAHDEVTAEELKGVAVQDLAGTRLGEVAELIVTTNGMLDKAVIDVGGFLGIGAKPVAVPMSRLRIAREAEGGGLRITTDLTRAELEAMPAWKG